MSPSQLIIQIQDPTPEITSAIMSLIQNFPNERQDIDIIATNCLTRATSPNPITEDQRDLS